NELVVTQADLRAAEAQFEGGAHRTPKAGEARAEGAEEPHTPDLVDESGNGHANEDGRLLDRADLAPDVEAVIVGEGERDALVGEAAVTRELALGHPPIGVRVGNGI